MNIVKDDTVSKFKAYGNWVAVKTVFKEEHVTSAGIVYKDDLPDNLMTWSEVVSVGPEVSEDILEILAAFISRMMRHLILYSHIIFSQ